MPQNEPDASLSPIDLAVLDDLRSLVADPDHDAAGDTPAGETSAGRIALLRRAHWAGVMEVQHTLLRLKMNALRKLSEIIDGPAVADAPAHRRWQLISRACIDVLRLKDLAPEPPKDAFPPPATSASEPNSAASKRAAKRTAATNDLNGYANDGPSVDAASPGDPTIASGNDTARAERQKRDASGVKGRGHRARQPRAHPQLAAPRCRTRDLLSDVLDGPCLTP